MATPVLLGRFEQSLQKSPLKRGYPSIKDALTGAYGPGAVLTCVRTFLQAYFSIRYWQKRRLTILNGLKQCCSSIVSLMGGWSNRELNSGWVESRRTIGTILHIRLVGGELSSV